jgi:SH3 domain-containing protein
VAVLSLLLTPSVRAQDVGEISADTRLRKEPDGIPVVALPAGTEVETGEARGEWHEVMVEGWIYTSSTSPTERDGFDLVVSAPNGENLRDSPNGQVVGRARTGALLRKLETNGDWTHVSRTGWVPRDAVNAPASADTPAVAQPVPPPPAAATVPAGKPTIDSDRAAVTRSTGLFATPQGGQYGTLENGAPTRIVGRNGEWVRVQTEGWVKESDLEEASGGALTGISAADVRSDPSRYVGRTVEWRLQLISVQTADELRTEIPRGQKYLLTRGPLPEPGFVYVTVTEAQATEFRSLPALQELTLRVVIKAAKTKYLTTPVVEFVSRVGE